MSSIVKEFYENQIDMRGPGCPNAKPIIDGTVCVLRFDDNSPLDMKRITSLFNEVVKDFGAIDGNFVNDHVEVKAKPPTKDYKKLPPKIIGSRG